MKNIKDCPSEHNSEFKLKMLKQVQHDDETELYKKLGKLTKNKADWENSISDIAALLDYDSTKIQAKALWLLGEMGLQHPEKIGKWVPAIAEFLNSPVPLLRERALNALGRIGRADFTLIKPFWNDLFRFAKDEAPEIFRVLGKRKPELVAPYINLLSKISEADSNRVVRIHALGAIKAFQKSEKK